MITRRIKDLVIGSPFEGLARWSHSRLVRSQDTKYDRQTIAVMKRSLRRDANCVDVGCHRGKILREMLKVSPSGVHYAFEPVPDSYQRLVSLYPSVNLYNLALSDIADETQFQYVVSNPALSGFRPRIHHRNERIQQVIVRTDLLDNVVPTHLPIQFIKIDVEGAELQVLRGAANTIRRNKPIIVFEHGLDMSTNYGTLPQEVYDFFRDGCSMCVSLMERWLEAERPLSQQEFSNQVYQRRNSYFIAYGN